MKWVWVGFAFLSGFSFAEVHEMGGALSRPPSLAPRRTNLSSGPSADLCAAAGREALMQVELGKTKAQLQRLEDLHRQLSDITTSFPYADRSRPSEAELDKLGVALPPIAIERLKSIKAEDWDRVGRPVLRDLLPRIESEKRAIKKHLDATVALLGDSAPLSSASAVSDKVAKGVKANTEVLVGKLRETLRNLNSLLASSDLDDQTRQQLLQTREQIQREITRFDGR